MTVLDRPHLSPPRAGTLRSRGPLVAIGVLAALPTLVGMVTGGFIADDWLVLDQERTSWTWWTHSIDVRFRPIQAAYHGLTFAVLGAHPAAHLLLVAALQALCAVLVVLVARRCFSPTTALVIGAVWAVLPNRGSTRLWISAAPVTVAIILLLLGALAATSDPQKSWLATLCCCLSVLCYEAGVALALAVVVWAWWRRGDDWRDTLVRSARGLVPFIATVEWNLATSPKKPTGSRGRLLGIPDAFFGHGLTPRALGPVAVVVVVAAIVAGIALGLRSERRTEVTRLLVGGAAVALLGSVPFVLAGFDQVNEGPFDRANAFGGLGVALVLAGALLGWWERRRTATSIVMVSAALLVVSANADDVWDVSAAARDGVRAVHAIAALPPGLHDQRLVLAPIQNHGYWIPFGFGSAEAAAATVTSGLRIRDSRYVLGPVRRNEVVVRLEGRQLVVEDASPRSSGG
jgi:hypothetical protein